jgi:hypothetical protein
MSDTLYYLRYFLDISAEDPFLQRAYLDSNIVVILFHNLFWLLNYLVGATIIGEKITF